MTNVDPNPNRIEAEILQEIISQTHAHGELQIFVGSDNIVRINSDGICVLRIRVEPGCRINLVNLDRETIINMLVPE